MLTMVIIQTLNNVKQWFKSMKILHHHLPLSILDTFNQGWTFWINKVYYFAYSDVNPQKTKCTKDVQASIWILSNILYNLKHAITMNNMAIWSNPCALLIDLKKQEEKKQDD